MYRMNPGRPRRLPRLLVLALAALALLCGWAAASARAANYVALGDSYAAGPLIPNQLLPLGCLKSDHNYAHLSAASIGLTLRDPSCSGATTDDMTADAERRTGAEPAPVQLARRRNRSRLADDRRQRHRLLRSGGELHHAEPVRDAVQGQIRLRRPRPAGRTDRTDGAEGRGGPAGDPQPRSQRPGVRRQLPGDLPGDGVRLLAAGADRVRRRALPAGDRAAPRPDARHPGGGQRSDPGRLVPSQHRPRLLQVVVGALGRTADPERTRGADPSQPSRDAGRRCGARRGGQRMGRHGRGAAPAAPLADRLAASPERWHIGPDADRQPRPLLDRDALRARARRAGRRRHPRVRLPGPPPRRCRG